MKYEIILNYEPILVFMNKEYSINISISFDEETQTYAFVLDDFFRKNFLQDHVQLLYPLKRQQFIEPIKNNTPAPIVDAIKQLLSDKKDDWLQGGHSFTPFEKKFV